MRGRDLTKRIEIWQTTPVADGVGGSTVSEAKIADSWAKIESLQPGKRVNFEQFGITDVNKAIVITLRKRSDIEYNPRNQFIKYRDKKYIISTTPTNKDFEDRFIVFIGIETKDG
jgi:SPP1 family predicted phage head-tail adaptor